MKMSDFLDLAASRLFPPHLTSGNGNGHNTQTRIPRTVTPDNVWKGLAVLFVSCWIIFALLLSPLLQKNVVWGLFATFLVLGISIFSGIIAEEIPDFHGVLLFNPWAKTRRVLFPGLWFKLPWEKVERDSSGAVVLTSLVRTISTKETKTHPTNDPAENMEMSLLIHMRINTVCSDKEAAENFIRFRSIKEEALEEIVRVEAEKMYAEYCGGQEMEDLLKPHVIQKAVMDVNGEDEEEGVKPGTIVKINAKKIEEMAKKNGVSIGIILESSKADKATQDMKRTPAMAEALRTARKKLTKDEVDKDGKVIDKGMDEDLADRASLLLDPNSDYTERRIDLHVDAPDLKNMTHLSILGGLGDDKNDKKGVKK